jgi:hypothetical protein
MKTKPEVIEILGEYSTAMFHTRTEHDAQLIKNEFADRLTEPEIDSTKVIRIPPQIIREGNEFPEAREIDEDVVKPEIGVEEIAMKIRIATGQPMQMSRVIAKALRPYYINAKVINSGDISTAASAYEKICCCEADHPWLKEYVNEDFVAGAKWMQEQ